MHRLISFLKTFKSKKVIKNINLAEENRESLLFEMSVDNKFEQHLLKYSDINVIQNCTINNTFLSEIALYIHNVVFKNCLIEVTKSTLCRYFQGDMLDLISGDVICRKNNLGYFGGFQHSFYKCNIYITDSSLEKIEFDKNKYFDKCCFYGGTYISNKLLKNENFILDASVRGLAFENIKINKKNIPSEYSLKFFESSTVQNVIFEDVNFLKESIGILKFVECKFINSKINPKYLTRFQKCIFGNGILADIESYNLEKSIYVNVRDCTFLNDKYLPHDKAFFLKNNFQKCLFKIANFKEYELSVHFVNENKFENDALLFPEGFFKDNLVKIDNFKYLPINQLEECLFRYEFNSPQEVFDNNSKNFNIVQIMVFSTLYKYALIDERLVSKRLLKPFVD